MALSGRHATQLQTKFNVLRNRAPGHQQVFLQHEGHMLVGPVDLVARYFDNASGRFGQTRPHVEQGAFATTRGANDGDHLTGCDRKRHIACRQHPRWRVGHTETLVDAYEFNGCWLGLCVTHRDLLHGLNLSHQRNNDSLKKYY